MKILIKSKDVEYPIENGNVTNWDDMEKVLHHTFYNELRIDPCEYPILVSESPLNSKGNRKKTIQLFFETFNVPSFCIAPQTIFSLYSVGHTTGLVVNCGHNASYFSPIYEGYSYPHAVPMQKIGGFDISNYLLKTLNDNGHSFLSSSDKEIVRNMMEKQCYVALDYDSELIKSKCSSECDSNYTLPDGNIITLSKERFDSTELLFKPHLNRFDYDGIDKYIFNSIMKCDIDIRKDLYSNIYLFGGLSMFEGFNERIEKEITDLAPKIYNIKAVAPQDRKYGCFIGASILGSIVTFAQMVITHDEYNDCGTRIVHRKCLF